MAGDVPRLQPNTSFQAFQAPTYRTGMAEAASQGVKAYRDWHEVGAAMASDGLKILEDEGKREAAKEA